MYGHPLIALEGRASTDAAVSVFIHRLRARGARVIAGDSSIPPAPSSPAEGPVVVVAIRIDADSVQAVRLGLEGFGLLVVGRAERSILDRLYDDLRSLGRLEILTEPVEDVAATLTVEERELLGLLAEGLTLGQAAATVHVSRRTADRLLASARRRLGVATTAEALVKVGSRTTRSLAARRSAMIRPARRDPSTGRWRRDRTVQRGWPARDRRRRPR